MFTLTEPVYGLCAPKIAYIWIVPFIQGTVSQWNREPLAVTLLPKYHLHVLNMLIVSLWKKYVSLCFTLDSVSEIPRALLSPTS